MFLRELHLCFVFTTCVALSHIFIYLIYIFTSLKRNSVCQSFRVSKPTMVILRYRYLDTATDIQILRYRYLDIDTFNRF